MKKNRTIQIGVSIAAVAILLIGLMLNVLTRTTLAAFILGTLAVWDRHHVITWPGSSKAARLVVRYAIQSAAAGLAVESAVSVLFFHSGGWIHVIAGLAMGGFFAWFLFEYIVIGRLRWTIGKDRLLPRNWNDKPRALMMTPFAGVRAGKNLF